MKKTLYIVEYSNNNPGYIMMMSSAPYQKFGTLVEMEDWIAENQETIRNVHIYEVAKEFKLKRDKPKLIRA